jgi:hypothetical protein
MQSIGLSTGLGGLQGGWNPGVLRQVVGLHGAAQDPLDGDEPLGCLVIDVHIAVPNVVDGTVKPEPPSRQAGRNRRVCPEMLELQQDVFFD